MVSQTLNWGVKWSWNFTNLLSIESWWNKESNETRINDSDLRSERYPYFKINKNSSLKLGEKFNLTTLHSNYLPNSNLIYINCKDYKRITLLTRLTWWFGFNSRGLKSIPWFRLWRAFGVQGEITIVFLQSICDYHASMAAELTLGSRGSRRT